MLISLRIVNISWYPCVSVLYLFISVHISAFLSISVHICPYLSISVHIQKLSFWKKLNFSKKISFKFVLRKGVPVRSSKIQNSLIHTRNRSQDLPGLSNSPIFSTDYAVKSYILLGTYFKKMFINVRICPYPCICEYLFKSL